MRFGSPQLNSQGSYCYVKVILLTHLRWEKSVKSLSKQNVFFAANSCLLNLEIMKGNGRSMLTQTFSNSAILRSLQLAEFVF